MPKEFIP